MADVSKITLPNGDTYDIKDAVARENADHGNARIFSADCSTAAATQRKDVTITECTELIAGDVFVITFTHAQTYNGVPTMQINSLGAKNIRRVTGKDAGRYEWNDGEVVVFKWTGTYFVITTGGAASTTYYGRTKLYSGAGSTSSALALAPISMYNMANRSICPYYSTSATYAVGDKVRYSDYIYECITAIPTAEAWTAAHWQVVPTLQEQVTSLDSKLAYETVSDFNNFAPAGTDVSRRYGCSFGGSAANAPIAGDNITYRGYSEGVADYYTQHFTSEHSDSRYNRGRSFVRSYLYNTFTAWRELKGVEPLIGINSNASASFWLTLYGRAVVTLIGYSSTTSGMCLVIRASNTASIIKWLGEAPSQISITMDSNGYFTVSNSGAAITFMEVEIKHY